MPYPTGILPRNGTDQPNIDNHTGLLHWQLLTKQASHHRYFGPDYRIKNPPGTGQAGKPGNLPPVEHSTSYEQAAKTIWNLAEHLER